MSLFGSLSSLLKKRNNGSDDSYGKEVKSCLIKSKLNKIEYELMSIYYYKGHTSYRSFFKYVFMRNISKIKKILDEAEKKAAKGCNIDFTFVRFYKDTLNYIDIPFDVFSEKRNMRMNRRNNKLWNKANIVRLLRNNPSLRDLDDDIISESIESLRMELLK